MPAQKYFTEADRLAAIRARRTTPEYLAEANRKGKLAQALKRRNRIADVLCACNCGEMAFSPARFVKGHHGRVKKPPRHYATKPFKFRVENEVAYILLPKGQEIMIDACDIHRLLGGRLHYLSLRVEIRFGDGDWIALHRYLVGLATHERTRVRFINENFLDCRKSNLVVVVKAVKAIKTPVVKAIKLPIVKAIKSPVVKAIKTPVMKTAVVKAIKAPVVRKVNESKATRLPTALELVQRKIKEQERDETIAFRIESYESETGLRCVSLMRNGQPTGETSLAQAAKPGKA